MIQNIHSKCSHSKILKHFECNTQSWGKKFCVSAYVFGIVWQVWIWVCALTQRWWTTETEKCLRCSSLFKSVFVCVLRHSVMASFVTPRTAACPATLSMGFFRQRILEWVAVFSSRGSWCVHNNNLLITFL